MKNPEIRTLIRNFAIEMVIYAVLVVGYFFLVLRLLGQPLERLFQSSLAAYAVAALVLILAQAVLLDAVTSYIMRWLGLDQLH